MARTALAAQADDGDVAFTAANADGHSLAGGGDVILLVDNASGAPVDVTVQTPAQVQGLDVEEYVVSVSAGAVGRLGTFRPATFDRPSGAVDAGSVYIDFSAVASVTVAALEV